MNKLAYIQKENKNEKKKNVVDYNDFSIFMLCISFKWLWWK